MCGSQPSSASPFPHKFAVSDFPDERFRKFAHKAYFTRQGVGCDIFSEHFHKFAAQFFFIAAISGNYAGADFFSHDLIGNSHNCTHNNAVMRVYHFLKILRINVVTARNYHSFKALTKIDESVFVHVSEVARV